MGRREIFGRHHESIDEFKKRYTNDSRELFDQIPSNKWDEHSMSLLFAANISIDTVLGPAQLPQLQLEEYNQTNLLIADPPLGYSDQANLKGMPILVKLKNNKWALVPTYKNSVPSILNSFADDLFMIPRKAFRLKRRSWATKHATPNFIGGLRITDAFRLADRMRHGKHKNPIQGVHASYLYEFCGDYDNILRIAHYYAMYGQPIPFDIALLACDKMNWNMESSNVPMISVDLPRVEETSEVNGRPEFSTRKMSAQEGAFVAGVAPIMRQGWSFLNSIIHEGPSDNFLENYLTLSKELRSSNYTTFTNHGVTLFQELFRYKEVELIR